MHVVDALFIEWLGGGSVHSPAEVQQHLESPQPAEAVQSSAGKPDARTLAAWGTDRAAQEGQRAMMAMLGGA